MTKAEFTDLMNKQELKNKVGKKDEVLGKMLTQICLQAYDFGFAEGLKQSLKIQREIYNLTNKYADN